jgi:hypothetical protein
MRKAARGDTDDSMKTIEQSIGSGVSDFETPKNKPKIKPYLIALIIAVVLFAASQFFSSSKMEVVNIASDAIVPSNEGKLVYITGDIIAEMKDPLFNLSQKAIELERIVQVYQWIEDGDKYSKGWKDSIIKIINPQAVEKGVANPMEMPFLSDKWQVSPVKIGAFTISPELIGKLGGAKDFPVTQEDFDKMDDDGKKAFVFNNGTYFFGLDIKKPRVGDIKVSFKKLDAGTVTILAQQKGDAIVPFKNEKLSVAKLVPGNVSLEIISQDVHLGSGPYLGWGMMGLSVIIGLFSLAGIAKTVKANMPKIGRKKKEEVVVNEAHDEDLEQSLSQEAEPEIEDAPFEQEDDFKVEPEIAPVALATVEIPAPHNDMAAANAEDKGLDFSFDEAALPLPPSPLTFNTAETEIKSDVAVNETAGDVPLYEESEELPEGIEIIGPDTVFTGKNESQEMAGENSFEIPLPPPQENTSVAENAYFDDDEEMPEGIEIIGPEEAEAEEESGDFASYEDVVSEEPLSAEDNEEELNIPHVQSALEYTPEIQSIPEVLKTEESYPEFIPAVSDYNIDLPLPSESEGSGNEYFMEDEDLKDLPTPPPPEPLDFDQPLSDEESEESESEESSFENLPPLPSPESLDFDQPLFDEEIAEVAPEQNPFINFPPPPEPLNFDKPLFDEESAEVTSEQNPFIDLPLPPEPQLDYENNNVADFEVDDLDDDLDDSDFDDEMGVEEYAPVPPLPAPDFMSIKQPEAASPPPAFDLPPPPPPMPMQPAPLDFAVKEPEQPTNSDDIFSSLLSNIPDDFDPSAEMAAPPAEETEEAGEGAFDPFAEEDDANHSPFAVHGDELK